MDRRVRVGQNKFHKSERLGQLAHHGRPSVARVAQSMQKDQRGRMLRRRLNDQRGPQEHGTLWAALIATGCRCTRR